MGTEDTNREQVAHEPTVEEIADALAARVVKGNKILDACEARIIDAIKVDGKTLREWGRELRVEMPEDSDDFAGMERASTEIADAQQRAEYILALFELKGNIASNYHEQRFATRYVEEMRNHKGKRIAAEKLTQLVRVDTGVDSSLAASQASRVVVDYFKRIVKGLEEARKGLENRTRLVGLRLRFLDNQ